MFGAMRPDAGRFEVGGEPMTAHSPGQSSAPGMAFCPEDRKAEGIFAELSVRENIIARPAGQARLAAAPVAQANRNGSRAR